MLQDMWLKHVVFRVITKVKNLCKSATYKGFFILAEWTGLEPATPGVTGRYSNQLNYHSTWLQILTRQKQLLLTHKFCKTWRPYGDSNPGTHRERVMS